MTPPPADAEPRSYEHASARRPNQPTAETAALMSDDDRAPTPFETARRLPEAVARVYEAGIDCDSVNLDRDLRTHPVLAWDRQGATSQISGDAQADAVHSFDGVPLYTREKVTPALLVEQLRRGEAHRALQLDFDGLDDEALEWEWYQHAGHWQNRLVHGDSAAVMQSLIAKDGLRDAVQMIYFDPPYGQNFKSNFQTTTGRLETSEKLDGLPVGDTMPLRAFRDSYRNGIHSYLDGIHERAVLARELLTDTGSLFVQIGDINVHRLALVLDEVFGPENRVATITWRPTGGSSARTLPESASYLLWYAKDKSRCRYRQLYEPLTSQRDVAEFFGIAAMVQVAQGVDRNLTKNERRNADAALPQGAELWQRGNLTSMGASTTGRTRWVEYDGHRYHCGDGRQWRVSVHDGDAPVCTPPDDNGARTEASPPCPDPEPCGLCWLGWTGRLGGSGKMLRWKQFASETPGRRIDNVWHRVTSARGQKRYVVQTASSIIERCMLMTTDPGDLVLDPTCGSGVTADVAEEWGRRWVTIDVSRVAIAVARQKLATSVYTWHRTTDGGTDPASDFVCKQMPKVSAGRLADPNTDWDHPDNVIRLVDQTETEPKRVRLASPFTVESHSPYSYLPFDTAPADTPQADPASARGDAGSDTAQPSVVGLGLASGEITDAVIDALYRSPVCDSGGRPLLQIVDHERWPEAHLATHGVACTRPGRDTQTRAGLMIAAPDATVTAPQVTRAAVEARRNAPDCANLIAVGFAFDPDVPAAVGACTVHRVVASKDLEIPELSKQGADGGTFTLLGEPDCEVRRTSDGTSLVVRLLGCDTYDPSTGTVRETDEDHIDCWMIDTDHDQMSFIARLTYFPNGLRNDAGLKAAMRSLGRDLVPDAQSHIISFLSQPFPIPPDGRPVAVKAITDTGAEMNTVIHPYAWQDAPDG